MTDVLCDCKPRPFQATLPDTITQLHASEAESDKWAIRSTRCPLPFVNIHTPSRPNGKRPTRCTLYYPTRLTPIKSPPLDPVFSSLFILYLDRAFMPGVQGSSHGSKPTVAPRLRRCDTSPSCPASRIQCYWRPSDSPSMRFEGY